MTPRRRPSSTEEIPFFAVTIRWTAANHSVSGSFGGVEDRVRRGECLLLAPVALVEGIESIDDLAHQIPHRVVTKMRDLRSWDFSPVRVDDNDVRIVLRPGDGRQPGVDVLKLRVADAHHGHDLGQMGSNTFFVIFIHRQTVSAKRRQTHPDVDCPRLPTGIV